MYGKLTRAELPWVRVAAELIDAFVGLGATTAIVFRYDKSSKTLCGEKSRVITKFMLISASKRTLTLILIIKDRISQLFIRGTVAERSKAADSSVSFLSIRTGFLLS